MLCNITQTTVQHSKPLTVFYVAQPPTGRVLITTRIEAVGECARVRPGSSFSVELDTTAWSWGGGRGGAPRVEQQGLGGRYNRD